VHVYYLTVDIGKNYVYGLTSDNMSTWRPKCFACLDYMGDKEDCQVISVTSQFIHQYTRYIDFSVYRNISLSADVSYLRRNSPRCCF
jgi:hypothetical protein